MPKDSIEKKLGELKKELLSGDLEGNDLLDPEKCLKLTSEIERLYKIAKKVFINQSKK